jgi:hypothetical protein
MDTYTILQGSNRLKVYYEFFFFLFFRQMNECQIMVQVDAMIKQMLNG